MSALAYLAQQLGLRVPLGRPLQCCSSLLRPGAARWYSTKTVDDVKDEIESINEMFVEARDEIEMAQEDAETVYFNESCQTAKELVQGVLDRWQAVLAELSEEERGKLQRSMGLKMEQLKAEVAQLDTLHD